MSLEKTVLVGPRDHVSGLPRRLDALGHLVPGRVPWTFQTLADGAPAGQDAGPTSAWRVRPGFGVTEGGLIVVGLALALARTKGAAEAGQTLSRRRGLDPRTEVVVVPDLVRAARALTEIPLAVVILSVTEAQPLHDELAATTRWSIRPAATDPAH